MWTQSQSIGKRSRKATVGELPSEGGILTAYRKAIILLDTVWWEEYDPFGSLIICFAESLPWVGRLF